MLCRWSTILIAVLFFFFNDTATTEIYTLSLHDALPISERADHLYHPGNSCGRARRSDALGQISRGFQLKTVLLKLAADRKSTRLNSSHLVISYAVFCLKKKRTTILIAQASTAYLRRHYV